MLDQAIRSCLWAEVSSASLLQNRMPAPGGAGEC